MYKSKFTGFVFMFIGLMIYVFCEAAETSPGFLYLFSCILVFIGLFLFSYMPEVPENPSKDNENEQPST